MREEMRDEYRVMVSLAATTNGSTDPDHPDADVSISFDATDAHMSLMLRKFQDLLNAMGYVTDGRHLALVRNGD